MLTIKTFAVYHKLQQNPVEFLPHIGRYSIPGDQAGDTSRKRSVQLRQMPLTFMKRDWEVGEVRSQQAPEGQFELNLKNEKETRRVGLD